MPSRLINQSPAIRHGGLGPVCLLALLLAGANLAWAQSPLRDPTRPAHYSAHTADHQSARHQHRFALESILYGAERHVAVIDGHAVIQGETVHGARVVRIEPAQVILEYKGRYRKLHWQQLVQVKQQ